MAHFSGNRYIPFHCIFRSEDNEKVSTLPRNCNPVNLETITVTSMMKHKHNRRQLLYLLHFHSCINAYFSSLQFYDGSSLFYTMGLVLKSFKFLKIIIDYINFELYSNFLRKFKILTIKKLFL